MGQTAGEEKIVVGQPRGYRVMGYVGLGLAAVQLVLLLGVLAEGSGVFLAVVLGLGFAGFGWLGLYLLLACRNQKLVAEGWDFYSSNAFGRVKEFRLPDIAKVRLERQPKSLFFHLVDADEKTLVRVEQNRPCCLDLLLHLRQQGVAFERMPRWLTVTMDCLDADIDPQTVLTPEDFAETGIHEPDWKAEGFGHRHRRGILLLSWGLRALSLGLIVGGYVYLEQLGLRAYFLALGLLPCLFFGLYIAFPKVMVWDKPAYADRDWKKAHLGVSFLFTGGCSALGLLLALVLEVWFVHPWQAFLFGLLLFVLPLWLMIWRTPRIRRRVAVISNMAVAVLAFGLAGCFLLNFSLRAAPPLHRLVPVAGARQNQDGDCYLRLLYAGKSFEFEASEEQYQRAQETGEVKICLQTSVFGLEMIRVHS